MSETIFALSTAPGKAGIAVVRVSGAGAADSLKSLIKKDKLPHARVASLTDLYAPDGGEIIDRALVIYFENANSFTGETVAEYHLHGSPAVIDSLLGALSKMPGHRPALPGEFTRRAFENGRLDLTEAEAIADLIDAETQAQRRQALDQMGGALSRLYAGWAERLTRALAHVEAVIDFPDEDVPDSETDKAKPEIQGLMAEIQAHLDDNRRGERLRSGIHVALIGAPNAGKSSLVNALARRDVAIVSEAAGTTRDVIEVHLDIGGFPVILSDTAGLRPEQLSDDAQGQIESEGIRRAIQKAEEADIRILVFDGTAEEDEHTKKLINRQSLTVVNKYDLFHVKQNADENSSRVLVSTKTGEGLDKLCTTLDKMIQASVGSARETPSLTRQRHRASLEKAKESLESSLTAAQPELMAEDMRMALRHIGEITGRVDVEDLLDVIFRDFCIGK